MQIKTTLKFHLIHSEWLPSRTQIRTNAGKDVGKKGTLIHRGWECKLVQPVQKSEKFLKKLKVELPYDLATLLLSISPKESKSAYYTGICITYIGTIHNCQAMESA
jgi:hypothetical protein